MNKHVFGKTTWLTFIAVFVMTASTASQDAKTIVQAAATAMRVGAVKTIRYSGSGWVAAVGQSYNSGLQNVGEGWPQFDVPAYTRTIDYDAKSIIEEITSTQGNHPARGGGGTPIRGEQRQTTILSGGYAWTVAGETTTPNPAAADARQLEIWLTPPGFIKAAMQSRDLTAFSRRILGVDDRVKTVNVVSFTIGKYRVNGMFNTENELEYVQTWIPNPVLGDMMYELRYTDYRDFNGVKFPTNIHGHTGGSGYDHTRGFWVLDPNSLQMNVTNVQPNIAVTALSVPANVRDTTVTSQRAESKKLADGVWLIGGGTHNSVAVEFRDYMAIVEAPLNEERSLAVMAEVQRLAPSKPIGYLVNTHHHFDHLGGIRTYWSDGATIITHLANREFIEKIVLSAAPRLLAPDRLSLHPIPTTSTPTDRIDTVTQKYVVSDGIHSLELHTVQSLNHAEHMLIAYLPKEKILINADLYSPPSAPDASSRTLYRNIIRLKLDVAQHVPIHGQPATHDDFIKAVGPQ